MTLKQLANKENELYSGVIELYNGKTETTSESKLNEIFNHYREIHKDYAGLGDNEIEALKRGLFIQWYSLTEPNYLTGISELDEKAEWKIITSLNRHIDQKTIDSELTWMLNYYLSWDWVFDQYKDIVEFNKTNDTEECSLPKQIDQQKMNKRGQMGIYWNSIIRE